MTFSIAWRTPMLKALWLSDMYDCVSLVHTLSNSYLIIQVKSNSYWLTLWNHSCLCGMCSAIHDLFQRKWGHNIRTGLTLLDSEMGSFLHHLPWMLSPAAFEHIRVNTRCICHDTLRHRRYEQNHPCINSMSKCSAHLLFRHRRNNLFSII